MSKHMLLSRLIFISFLVTFSLNSHAEKFNSKNLKNLKMQIEADGSDFYKIKNLGIDDQIVIMSFTKTSSDLSQKLQFLISLSYIYKEMSNKHDQEVLRQAIEDQKKMYQGKCDTEKEYRYHFKVEDVTLALKLEEFYKNIMNSCDIVKKWN